MQVSTHHGKTTDGGSEERRVTVNSIRVPHPEHAVMLKEAFLDGVSGEGGPVVRKLGSGTVAVEHGPLVVAVQQDARALHEIMSVLG